MPSNQHGNARRADWRTSWHLGWQLDVLIGRRLALTTVELAATRPPNSSRGIHSRPPNTPPIGQLWTRGLAHTAAKSTKKVSDYQGECAYPWRGLG